MKGKAMFAALLMVALVAAPIGLAYAGGGGSGGPNGEIFIQCYGVSNGPNPPHLMEVNDQFIDPSHERVGKLKLICTFPSVTLLNESDTVQFNPINNPSLDQHITCYEVNGGADVHANVIYNDTFFAGDQTTTTPTGVRAKVEGATKFVCVLANKTCLKGCPGITTP